MVENPLNNKIRAEKPPKRPKNKEKHPKIRFFDFYRLPGIKFLKNFVTIELPVAENPRGGQNSKEIRKSKKTGFSDFSTYTGVQGADQLRVIFSLQTRCRPTQRKRDLEKIFSHLSRSCF